MNSIIRSCLVVKFKIPNLSHRTKTLHAQRIKSRRNKQLIAQFACKGSDEIIRRREVVSLTFLSGKLCSLSLDQGDHHLPHSFILARNQFLETAQQRNNKPIIKPAEAKPLGSWRSSWQIRLDVLGSDGILCQLIGSDQGDASVLVPETKKLKCRLKENKN